MGQPPVEELYGRGRLPLGDVQGGQRLDRLRELPELGQHRFGLFEPAMADPEPGESGHRVRTAGAVTGTALATHVSAPVYTASVLDRFAGSDS